MGKDRYMLFSSSMKMADIILRNYSLLSILPRFDIRLGFGEKSLKEVCEKYGIDTHFFLLVCNTHTYADYLPSKDELSCLNIESLITYLQKSHSYYIKNRITSIEKKLIQMGDCCNENHYHIIQNFFTEYKQEVMNHFNYEEEVVFPYIKNLWEGKQQVDYHINQYEQNHSNIDDKLSDLKNIVIKYLPESCSSEDRNDVLLDIFLFEEDLEKHTRIEDNILIPYVSEFEKSNGK